MSKSTALYRWLLVLALLLPGVYFTFNSMSVDDNALDLLPDGAVKGDLKILQELGLVDRLFITLSAGESEYPGQLAAEEVLKKSADSLGKLLQQNENLSFVMARLPGGYEGQLFKTMQDALPGLFDKNDLTEIEKRMTPTGLKAVMQKNFALLNSPAGIAMKKQVQQDPLGLMGIVLNKLKQLRSEFSMRLVDGFFMSSDGRSCLVMAESKLSLTDSNDAEIIQAELEESFAASLPPGVEARVIGSLPHTLANSRSIQRDLKILLPAATLLLLLLLGLTLRDIRALVVLSVPFLAAFPAIALTSFLFGKISALALGFGIVLLGIAVDFSIHLYLVLSRERGRRQELLRSLRKPMLFATLTTTSVLTVLLFSDVASHRQMATLALSGVLLAVLFAWLIIPAIVPDKNGPEEPGDEPYGADIKTFSPWTQKTTLILWLLLLLAGAATWPQLKYNGDLRVLDVPDPQVIADEAHFGATWGEKGDQAFVVSVGKSMAQALDINSRVYAFLTANGFETFQSLAPILPGPGVQADNRRSWQEFWSERRPAFDNRFAVVAEEQGFARHGFKPFFTKIESEPSLLLPEKLLNSPLQAMVATMIRSSNADMTGGDKNKFMVLTTVAIADDTLPLLLSFADEEPGISVLANRKWRAEIEKLLRKDIISLCLAAGCVIVLLVALQFRKVDATIAVLAPVLSALAAMSVFCWLTNVELNMMHLIMGILVIGLSVDYGIFVVCSKLNRYTKTASVAVSICAASSLIGFGVLTFASHPALHSLGVTVLVGIGAAWPVALFVSPSLVKKRSMVLP